MLQHLRQNENIMLYSNLLQVSEEHEAEAADYLKTQYNQEATDYPFTAPDFDKAAALWGARTVYIAAQLMLYREHKVADLENMLPVFTGEITANAMLSADLYLRFLPGIINHLKLIEPEDGLIPILEKHLHTWHYSGIAYPLEKTKLDFSIITAHKCLHQLYVNRVVQYKNLGLARHPALSRLLRANLGIYRPEFWPGLTFELTPDDTHSEIK